MLGALFILGGLGAAAVLALLTAVAFSLARRPF